MIRANIFTGSLAVFNKERGEASQILGAGRRRFRRRNAFELFLEYSTSKEFASRFGSPRSARRLNCIEFWAEKSVGYFVRGKENF